MTQDMIFLPRGPQSVLDSIAIYCRQRPQLKEILETFQPIFEKRASLAEKFSSMELHDIPALDFGRWNMENQGISILAGVPLSFLAAWLNISLQEMLPLLQANMPNGQELEKVNKAFEQGKLNPVTCLETLIAGDLPGMKRFAEKTNCSESVLYFACSMIASPALEALTGPILQQVPELFWKEGFCPVCGSFPSIAVLSRPEKTALESLIGGGGKKFLHCSLCGHEWYFRRDTCPACQNAEPGTKEIFYASKAKQERTRQDGRGRIKDAVSIELRPKEVEDG